MELKGVREFANGIEGEMSKRGGDNGGNNWRNLTRSGERENGRAL